MDSLNFCYFLQGFLEVNNDENQQMSSQQVQIIKDHLALVFKKETPVYQGVQTRVTLGDGYGHDLDGIKFTNIKLPIYGDQIQNSDPNNILKDIYIDTEIIPHTPVEKTTTHPFIRWDGPQVSC